MTTDNIGYRVERLAFPGAIPEILTTCLLQRDAEGCARRAVEGKYMERARVIRVHEQEVFYVESEK